MFNFNEKIKWNIKLKVRELISGGTIGMTRRNLFAVVPTPSSSLDGAPCGANAAHAYREAFYRVLNNTRLPRGFIVHTT